MFKEFKEFATRGNVLDLATGFIMGAAFTAIVSALVDNVLMPPIGLLLGGLDFSNLFVNLTGADYDAAWGLPVTRRPVALPLSG